jgi:uncharacterized protein YecE (DUF72 family)
MGQDELFSASAPEPVGRRRNVRIGLCSWSDPSLIKSKTFYPRGTGTPEGRLRFYAQNFPVVEVDSSFYAMPDPANSVKWAERTPDNFRFNIKAFRLLTGHQTPPQVFPPDIVGALPALKAGKRNHYIADLPPDIVDEIWRRFILAVTPLREAGKLLAVHFQFAPWVSNTRVWRAHVEDCVARMAGHLVAIEFRNATWFGEHKAQETLQWLREMRVVHTIVDEPQGVGNYAQGIWEVTHPDLAVVRLHGRNAETWDAKGLAASSDRFNYEYTDPELDELSGRIDRIVDQALDVVVLLNVNYEDQGVRAAQALERRQQRILDPGGQRG